MELSDICFTSNYIELFITLFDQSKLGLTIFEILKDEYCTLFLKQILIV